MSPYSKILVPIDFSQHSTEALARARDIATRFNSELHLITVVEPWPPAVSVTAELYPLYHDYVVQAQAKATAQLKDLAATVAGSTPVQYVTGRDIFSMKS